MVKYEPYSLSGTVTFALDNGTVITADGRIELSIDSKTIFIQSEPEPGHVVSAPIGVESLIEAKIYCDGRFGDTVAIKNPKEKDV
jgi:hypothetical protein